MLCYFPLSLPLLSAHTILQWESHLHIMPFFYLNISPHYRLRLHCKSSLFAHVTLTRPIRKQTYKTQLDASFECESEHVQKNLRISYITRSRLAQCSVYNHGRGHLRSKCYMPAYRRPRPLATCLINFYYCPILYHTSTKYDRRMEDKK